MSPAFAVDMESALVFVMLFLVFISSHSAWADVRVAERFSAHSIHAFEQIALPDLLADILSASSGSSPFLLMPADGRVSSLFGWRRDPLDGGRRFHAGVDVAGLRDSRVVAVAAGRVRFSGWSGGCGWMAVVEHGGGIETRYCHLDLLRVRQGEGVVAGAVVGWMGGTGRATGTHLHFEVREGGRPVNPVSLLMF